MRVANCVQASSAFAIRPHAFLFSIPLGGLDRPDACDDGERPWSSKPPLPSSAPSSRQLPSVDDQDHQGAMCQ